MLRNNKIYMAGPLFKESDQVQKIKEGHELREIGFDPFNPIENLVVGDGNVFEAQAVFTLDDDAISESAFFYFDLDNHDTGTFAEFGQVIERVKNGIVDPKNVVVVTCDAGRHQTYGTNYYLTHIFNAYPGGAILKLGMVIATDFAEAKEYLKDRLEEVLSN